MSYSYYDKNELKTQFKTLFENLKSVGITSLRVKESICKYCYPNKEVFEFCNPFNNEIVVRYVIFKESKEFYRVEECKNKPTNKIKNGFPF